MDMVMRSRPFAIVVLLALPLAGTVQADPVAHVSVDSQAEPRPAAAADLPTLIEAARAAYARKEFEAADSQLQIVLADPGFATLASESQRNTLVMNAWAVALSPKPDLERAHALVMRTGDYPDAGAADWTSRLYLAGRANDPVDALRATVTLGRRWPAALNRIEDETLRWVIRRAPKALEDPQRYELSSVLFDAHYAPHDGTDLSYLWRDLVLMELGRGQPEKALAVAKAIIDPYELVVLDADNRFLAVRDVAGQAEGVSAAAERLIEHYRAAVAAAPDQLQPVSGLAVALLNAKRYHDVLQLAEVVEAQAPEAYRDYPANINWVMDTQGRALASLGRPDEAVAQWRKAIQFDEYKVANVSQRMNLAELLNYLGRPDEAMKLLDEVTSASPYGKAEAAVERISAGDQQGNAQQVQQWVTYLQEHTSDAPRALVDGLINANHLPEAAKALAMRISDPQQRAAALLAVQGFDPPCDFERAREVQRRWATVIASSEVQAAVRRFGRISRYPLRARGML